MILKIIKSTFLQFALIFVTVCLGFVFYSQLFKFPYFLREDSFYHVAITKYMVQNGLVVHQFPYLNFTILKDNFVDWHFGFHLLMIPFIKLFGEINGPKIMEMLIVAGVFGLVFLILKEYKLKFAIFYSLIMFFLMMPAAFYIRMTTIRAPMLSLLLLLLTLYFFIKNRPWALAVTVILYGWAYYLVSYLIFVPLLGYIIVQILRKEKVNYQILIFTALAYVASLIINPYFPSNISSLFVQLKAASQNNRWYAGIEWKSPVAWDWFYATTASTLLFLSAIVISLIKNIWHKAETLAIITFSVVILILQWKSQRFYEYWPVFGGMIGFLLIGQYVEDVLLKIRLNWKRAETILVVILILVFVQLMFFHGIWEYMETKKTIQNELDGQMVESLKSVGTYLDNNSSKGDIVFARWDFFPYLFYFDQKNYYVGGLDPIFTEKYDSFLFQKYIALTLVNETTDLDASVIKNDFHARWVVIGGTQTNLNKLITEKPEIFNKSYNIGDYTVYKVN